MCKADSTQGAIMRVMHGRVPPRIRRTISTDVTDRKAGERIADRIQRRQRDRGEKQYLARRAQRRQKDADCSHHLSAKSSRVARRWLPHRMHPICQRIVPDPCSSGDFYKACLG